jgi:hypothetical protein
MRRKMLFSLMSALTEHGDLHHCFRSFILADCPCSAWFRPMIPAVGADMILQKEKKPWWKLQQ